MNWELIGFVALSGVMLAAAYMVVAADVIVHAVLFMALAFVAVAGMFLLLGSDMLFAAQLLVYVGAVTAMVIFAVMLSDIREVRGPETAGARWLRRALRTRWGVWPLVVAAGFAALMVGVYRGSAFWTLGPPGPAESTVLPIGRALFSTYLIPFEVLSVLLLAAMVGAVILTMRRRDETEKPGEGGE